ncbi:MAG: diphthine synthase [Candidatus Woesearchaeota archaeon]
MTLYMIGLGLDNEKDITIKGLDAIKISDYVFLEDYTSMLNCSVKNLERFYERKVILANREMVEKNSDFILDKAIKKNVAFLVIGDVFSATTHVDLFLRAKEKKIEIKVINNTSILNAVGIVGLELYKYGKTTSMPFFESNFKPESPYEAVKENLSRGLHTLVLLDIKKDLNKFMSVNVALKQFLEIEDKRKEGVFSLNMKAIGCARIGSENQVIKYGLIRDLIDYDFGKPLHCLIVPGKLHFMEEEMLRLWI